MVAIGNGFLALWNDHVDERGRYDFWHTREHVGERLGVPGFRFARRYVGGEGSLPRYFTLYGLANVDVLRSGAYRALVANPSEWSQQMRPGMRSFLRRGCRHLASFGGGLGGLLGASLVKLDVSAADAVATLGNEAGFRPFTAMHLGQVDPSLEPLAFGGAEPEVAEGADAVLLVEGYEERTFRPGLAALSKRLHKSGFSADPASFTTYRLAFALSSEERLDMPPIRNA